MTADNIDIILPTYHPNLVLLERAVQSIINQQYTNWVLYLIQDGDDCDVLSLVNSFNDLRIRYFEIPHSGKAAAINFALAKSNSKYIAYQDDDDIWYPNHLMESLSYMKANDARFVHTDAHEVFITMTNQNEFNETSRRKLNQGLLTDLTLYYISHINVVHERELLKKAGIYDVSLQFYIDWDMFQRLARYAKPHHICSYTCEHYIYSNKDNAIINTISSTYNNNPKLQDDKMKEMFKKSFELLTADNYLELLQDWQQKEQKITKLSEELNQFINSKSWCITKPIRFLAGLFYNFFLLK